MAIAKLRVLGSAAWAGQTGQAQKGARGMPRRGQAMKDVASCDKPWGGARILRSTDFRMGQPDGWQHPSPSARRELTQGTETSQYLEEEKSNEIP